MNIKRNIIFALESRKKNGVPIVENVPIRMRVIYASQRIEFTTGYRIDVAKWDSDKQRVKNGCTNKLKQSASEINADLLKYYAEIQNVFKEFEVQETMPTTQQLKDAFNLRMKNANEEQQEYMRALLRVLASQMDGDREIEKSYLCVVSGRPKPAEGRLEGYLFKDAVKNQVYVTKKPQPGAKTAVTEYRTLQSRQGLSLVECRLLTGRTHQIRAQMAAAGCPLLGDGKYGRERINRTYGETGQMLYSYKLTFTLPTDAGILEYLRGQTFRVPQVAFAEKYFPGFQIP